MFAIGAILWLIESPEGDGGDASLSEKDARMSGRILPRRQRASRTGNNRAGVIGGGVARKRRKATQSQEIPASASASHEEGGTPSGGAEKTAAVETPPESQTGASE